MTPLVRGLLIAAIQVGLVASLGGKLLYDRATLPRVWVPTMPVDPDLPIRGRYVQLRVVVDAPDIPLPDDGQPIQAPAVSLRVAGDALMADPVPEGEEGQALRYFAGEELVVATLEEPLAFFIPENVPDPSLRPEGESLWVEVTVPRRGPPRPIRLGVQRDDGPVVPLSP